MPRRLLLVSNSTLHGHGYLDHCADALRAVFAGRDVVFVPYARPGGISHDAYAARAAERFEGLGLRLRSVHAAADAARAAAEAEGFFVGGGNTFLLLRGLYETGLVDVIRRRVAEGHPYVGTSAGSNVAGRSIGTTNDMPIVEPPSFEALGLVPFNLNPHYLDPDPASTHMGETREQRIAEFHVQNPQPVVGLREGAWLDVDGDRMHLRGTFGARLFRAGAAPDEAAAGADLSELLT